MFESNRELLGLCYDTLKEIRDGFYIVSNQGLYGVIDAGNKVIIKIKNEDIIQIGETLYIEENKRRGYKPYSTIDFKAKSKEEKFFTMKRFSDNAYMVSNYELFYRETFGILNNQEELVLPMIYTSIWISSKNSMYDYIKARTIIGETADMPADKLSFIIMNREYTKADCLAAIETELEGTQIVATEYKSKYTYGDMGLTFKYQLRYNGKLIGKKFDGIQTRSALKSYGIMQTYLNSKTGLIYNNGEELVPAEFEDVQYIGNGITVVKGSKGYGTFVNGKEVISRGFLEGTYIMRSIPITMGIKGDKQYFIGNNGYIYERIEEAFPIYKSKIDANVNMMCLYGTWVFINNYLERITSLDNKFKDITQWEKI